MSTKREHTMKQSAAFSSPVSTLYARALRSMTHLLATKTRNGLHFISLNFSRLFPLPRGKRQLKFRVAFYDSLISMLICMSL